MSNRSEYLSSVKSIVVKLGTQLLSDFDGKIDAAFVGAIALQVADMRERGILATIVSSGAIGCGVRELNLPKRPTDLAKLQAVAAVGQRRLMDVWAEAFRPYHLPVAQILLTREDIDDRTRFLNLRNTIGAVHELGAVPIINENDTVSTAELVKITFGDNDILAATVAHALRAHLLVLLTIVDGILDSQGAPIRTVVSADAAREFVRAEKSAVGRGGMDSKVQAARMVTDAGEAMVVAHGRMEKSSFAFSMEKNSARSSSPRQRSDRRAADGLVRFVRPGQSSSMKGREALCENNKSLLPAGVIQVTGNFSRGDIVSVQLVDGAIVARGLSNYSSADMDRIRGRKTNEVRELLAEGAYDEVIHRDNLVLERPKTA